MLMMMMMTTMTMTMTMLVVVVVVLGRWRLIYSDIVKIKALRYIPFDEYLTIEDSDFVLDIPFGDKTCGVARGCGLGAVACAAFRRPVDPASRPSGPLQFKFA